MTPSRNVYNRFWNIQSYFPLPYFFENVSNNLTSSIFLICVKLRDTSGRKQSELEVSNNLKLDQDLHLVSTMSVPGSNAVSFFNLTDDIIKPLIDICAEVLGNCFTINL